ncbi:MAG: hypothetical protein QHG98_07440 [Methanothrix sp.]|jgi:hypothetical protein|nr:hypothetical protein [Methanothrix sp.]
MARKLFAYRDGTDEQRALVCNDAGALKVSMAGMDYRARVQVVDPFADPLVVSSAQPLVEKALPEGYTAGSVYTFRVVYKNVDVYPKTVLVRVIGKNADGDVYFQMYRSPSEVMAPVLDNCT